MSDLEARAKSYANAHLMDYGRFDLITKAYLAGAREQARTDAEIAERAYEAFGNGARKIASKILASVGEGGGT